MTNFAFKGSRSTLTLVSVATAFLTIHVSCGNPLDGPTAGFGREALANKLDELQIPDEFVFIEETYSEGPGLFVIDNEATLFRNYGLEGIDPENAVAKFVEANSGLEQTGSSQGLWSFQDGDYRLAVFFDVGSRDPGEQLPKGVKLAISIAREPS